MRAGAQYQKDRCGLTACGRPSAGPYRLIGPASPYQCATIIALERWSAGIESYAVAVSRARSGPPNMFAKSWRTFHNLESTNALVGMIGTPMGRSTSVTASDAATAAVDDTRVCSRASSHSAPAAYAIGNTGPM